MTAGQLRSDGARRELDETNLWVPCDVGGVEFTTLDGLPALSAPGTWAWCPGWHR